jgi:hypothetical protein
VGALPVGEAAWSDTRLDTAWLPAGTRLDDVLGGRSLATAGDDGLALARVFAVLPLALLHYDLSAAPRP